MPQCRNAPKAYYKGTEPSPKGKGYCARAEPVGKRRKGGDGKMWTVKTHKMKGKTVKAWRRSTTTTATTKKTTKPITKKKVVKSKSTTKTKVKAKRTKVSSLKGGDVFEFTDINWNDRMTPDMLDTHIVQPLKTLIDSNDHNQIQNFVLLIQTKHVYNKLEQELNVLATKLEINAKRKIAQSLIDEIQEYNRVVNRLLIQYRRIPLNINPIIRHQIVQLGIIFKTGKDLNTKFRTAPNDRRRQRRDADQRRLAIEMSMHQMNSDSDSD